jgi:hypothetical protein
MRACPLFEHCVTGSQIEEMIATQDATTSVVTRKRKVLEFMRSKFGVLPLGWSEEKRRAVSLYDNTDGAVLVRRNGPGSNGRFPCVYMGFTISHE